MQPLDRFMSKVEQTDDCWIWRASVVPKGYGHVWFDGRLQLAHRVAYQIFVGPIPDGLTIDHLCRNPPCVNPSHMEVVTVRENTLRGEGRGAQNARRTECPRGHPYSGDNLRLWHGYRRCRACVPIRWAELSPEKRADIRVQKRRYYAAARERRRARAEVNP